MCRHLNYTTVTATFLIFNRPETSKKMEVTQGPLTSKRGTRGRERLPLLPFLAGWHSGSNAGRGARRPATVVVLCAQQCS